MEISDLVIRIIFLLIPGLVSTVLISSLVTKREIKNRDFVTYVILLGFINYSTFYIFKSTIFKDKNLTFFKALLNSEIEINIMEVFYTTIISVFIGIIISFLINKGVFYSIMNFFRISNRTGSSVWGEFINYKNNGINSYIYLVDLENDLVYGGIVKNYSNNDSDKIELVLDNVVVTKNSNRRRALRNLPSAYLCYQKEKIIIEVGDDIDEKDSEKRLKSKKTKSKE